VNLEGKNLEGDSGGIHKLLVVWNEENSEG